MIFTACRFRSSAGTGSEQREDKRLGSTSQKSRLLGFHTQELPRHRIDLGEISRDLLIAAALTGDRMEAAARECLGRACAAKMDYRGKLPLLLRADRHL